jgi:hypothetical protein
MNQLMEEVERRVALRPPGERAAFRIAFYEGLLETARELREATTAKVIAAYDRRWLKGPEGKA